MTYKWSTPFRYWIMTAVAIGLIIVIWLVRGAIGPLVIAALLAFILNPIVDFLNRRARFPRTLAIVVSLILSMAVLGALPAAFLPRLIEEIRTLTVDLQAGIVQLQEFISKPIIIYEWQINLEALLPNPVDWFSESTLGFTGDALRFIETTTENLLWLLVILVTIFFLLKDWTKLRTWLLNVPPEPYRKDALRIFLEIDEIWKGYLRGNLLLMAIVGSIFSLIWFVLGVPGGLILGIIAGVLTIIPDVGPMISAILAVLVCLIEGSNYLNLSNFWFAVIIFGIYVGTINIINIWIRPRIFGRSVHMHDGLVFLSIIISVIIWGILGALIVVPLLASLAVILRYIYRMAQKIDPWPEEDEEEVIEEDS